MENFDGGMCKPVFYYLVQHSQKMLTHSTIKVLLQPTFSECVSTFPCSLPRACQNENQGKLHQFAMPQGGSKLSIILVGGALHGFELVLQVCEILVLS